MKTKLSVVGIILLMTYASGQRAPVQGLPGRGTEWLSWSTAQRRNYVRGYIDGYLGGYLRGCQSADELFEKGKAHHPRDTSHPTDSDMPSARCLDRRGEFSKISRQQSGDLDVSAYTEVLTIFYEKHGNCRNFPYTFLLEELGQRYTTPDGLYELATKAGIKGTETRAREWCNAEQAPVADR